jgi:N-hydroxyarylamine O-acetyltransferase
MKVAIVSETKEFKRYLSLLDVPWGEPNIGMLARLIRAHLRRVPFENISKLYYWKTMGLHASMDLTQYLDGIDRFQFGGTCYSNAFHLNGLLRYLGFEARLCGADMSKPDVHIVNVVRVEGREYLVDVGYAAPFLAPIPLDLRENYSISFGTDTYVIRPTDLSGRTRVELHRKGTLYHGYLVNPLSRGIQEFSEVIAASFSGDAVFMNAVLLVRFEEGSSTVIHNKELIETQGTKVTRTLLSTPDRLVDAIQTAFGIPNNMVRLALNGMTLERGAWN